MSPAAESFSCIDLLPGEIALIPHLAVLHPQLLVDVGSGFEEYTNLLRQHFPSAEVHSFDPQSGTPAIGGRDGEVVFRVFPGCPQRSTGASNYRDQIEGFSLVRKVPVRRLDTLFPGRQIDFLKIDVEGMEWDVLEGLGVLRPTLVQFEYGFATELEGHPLTHFGALFHSWGYTIQQIDWDANYGNWLAGTPETLSKVGAKR